MGRGVFHLRIAGITLSPPFQSDVFLGINFTLFEAFSACLASLVTSGHQSAFLCHLQVSSPSVLGLRIERVCVDQIHSNRLGLPLQSRPNLSHMCCFDSGRCGCVCCHCVIKSFLCGVLLPRHWQSCAVNFAGWASCRVTKLFKVCSEVVDTAGSSVVTVIGFGRSGFNIRQLWDDQHRIRQICRNIGWIRLLRRFTDVLLLSVVVSLLLWYLSHGLSLSTTSTPNLCRVRFR